MSADETIKLWQMVYNEGKGRDCRLADVKLLSTLQYKRARKNKFDVPTAMSWITGETNQIAAGYLHSNKIVLFDYEQVI